jgi:hypothetical protein
MWGDAHVCVDARAAWGGQISEAEEEEERSKREELQREKYDLWAQREADMSQGF